MYFGYKLGIVVPVYNESEFISATLEGIPEFADRIYVVDDGSTDNTRDIAGRFDGGRYNLMTNGRNRGVGATVIRGYKKALEEGMDIVVVMDGDNQMDARYLPDLLEPIITNEAQFVKGNRLSRLSHRKGMSNWRFLGNWILTLLTKVVSGYWGLMDSQNGYTAITGDTLKLIDLDRIYPRYGYCNDLLVKLNIVGCKAINVPIPARYANETSKIRYERYIIGVSYLLLRNYLWRLKIKWFK